MLKKINIFIKECHQYNHYLKRKIYIAEYLDENCLFKYI